MKALIAVPAVLAAAIALAPAAQADPSGFLADLGEHGIAISDLNQMVSLGNITCNQIRSGVPLTTQQAAARGADISVGGPVEQAGYTVTETETITVVAVKDLCPDQWATLQAAASGG